MGRRLAAGCLVMCMVGACAAPPMGLGVGAVRPGGAGASGAMVAGSAGLGASGTRTMFQAEAAASYLHRARGSRSGVGVDLGMVYTQLAEQQQGMPEITAAGGFPYVRPRAQLGPVAIAVALAGFGIGAGGGGVYGGIADVQVGYAATTWSVYAGAYSLVWDVTGGDRAVGTQLRAGAEVLLTREPARLGLAVELYAHDDALVDRAQGGGEVIGRDRSTRVESSFLGGGLKLTLATGLLE